jgi:hypothetical protein
MTEDARFEDASEAPLHLKAFEPEDLQVISALVQDAVFPASEMKWDHRGRRFAMLINRFRWENKVATPERVQSVLVFEDVESVASQGIDRNDKDMILSLLSIGFEPGNDGTGRIELVLAGDGAIALNVEALEVTLRDMTRPYLAPSGKVPGHP